MSPDPPSPLRVRPARRDEIPALCRIGREAFRGRPLTEAINPPHLVGEAGDEAVVEFRAARQRRVFDDPEKHFVVVEDAGAGAGEVAGYAIWHAYPVGPVVAAPPPASETAEARAARLAKLPPIVDVAALETLERETVLLDQTIRDALGEEGYENSWYLDAIAVHPAHQRRGIGKMLMDWGQDRADKEHRNVRFMASEQGAKLYRACGYEQVGSREILGGMEYAFIKRAQQS